MARKAGVSRTPASRREAADLVQELYCAGRPGCKVDRHLSRDPEAASAFAPDMPSSWIGNPKEWLTNFDIDKAVRGLFRNRRTVRYLGVQSIDFLEKDSAGRCVSKYCDRPILSPGISTVVLVLNLDRHTQGGSHWVAVVGMLSPSNPRFGIYYFDSFGRAPLPMTQGFMRALASETQREKGSLPPLMYNSLKVQTANTECGVYCIQFLSAMLTTRKGFSSVCRSMPDDERMNQLRQTFFHPSDRE